LIDLGDEERPDVSTGQHVAPNAPCRLDGTVVKFPLAPDAINNLALLREASKDLARHLEVVNKRIIQLEEKERKKTMKPLGPRLNSKHTCAVNPALAIFSIISSCYFIVEWNNICRISTRLCSLNIFLVSWRYPVLRVL
jgi:hypothetical protein